MRIVVTGASGFVGAHLACFLSRRGYEVFALGGAEEIATAVREEVAGSGLVDIRSADSLRANLLALEPDVVVHCAALARMAECEQSPDEAWRLNAAAPMEIAHLLRATLPLYVYISTDLVFDGLEAPPGGFIEEAEPVPRSVYARSKLEGERRVLSTYPRAWVLRLSLVYGPRIGRHEGFMGWLRGGLAEQKPVRLFVDEFRTPLYVGDAAAAIDALIRREPSLSDSRLLHVSGGERLSRYDFGCLVAAAFDLDQDLLVACRSEGGRPKDASLANRKLRQLLEVTPVECEEGLRSVLEGS